MYTQNLKGLIFLDMQLSMILDVLANKILFFKHLITRKKYSLLLRLYYIQVNTGNYDDVKLKLKQHNYRLEMFFRIVDPL